MARAFQLWNYIQMPACGGRRRVVDGGGIVGANADGVADRPRQGVIYNVLGPPFTGSLVLLVTLVNRAAFGLFQADNLAEAIDIAESYPPSRPVVVVSVLFWCLLFVLSSVVRVDVGAVIPPLVILIISLWVFSGSSSPTG